MLASVQSSDDVRTLMDAAQQNLFVVCKRHPCGYDRAAHRTARPQIVHPPPSFMRWLSPLFAPPPQPPNLDRGPGGVDNPTTTNYKLPSVIITKSITRQLRNTRGHDLSIFLGSRPGQGWWRCVDDESTTIRSRLLNAKPAMDDPGPVSWAIFAMKNLAV
ncbi:hypothetical protein LZ31DRAFT_260216 [Colletotrichum somersetense]|nr:hypothetical protein LZ31DRAFT_260216 [Colletotrichum somersetense]